LFDLLAKWYKLVLHGINKQNASNQIMSSLYQIIAPFVTLQYINIYITGLSCIYHYCTTIQSDIQF